MAGVGQEMHAGPTGPTFTISLSLLPPPFPNSPADGNTAMEVGPTQPPEHSDQLWNFAPPQTCGHRK